MFEISIRKRKCLTENGILLPIWSSAESEVQNMEQFQCSEISGTHIYVGLLQLWTALIPEQWDFYNA